MKFDSQRQQRRDFWFGAVLSVLLHLAALAAILVVAATAEDTEDEPDEEPEYTEVVLDERLDDSPDPLDPRDSEATQPSMPQPESDRLREEDQPREEDKEEEVEEQQEDVPDEEEEEETEEELESPPQDMAAAYAVEQQANEEDPDEAAHIADEANRTDEETVADVTTLEDVEIPDDPEAVEQDQEAPLEIAMAEPTEVEPPEPIDDELAREDAQESAEDQEEGEPAAESEPEEEQIEEQQAEEQEEEEQEAPSQQASQEYRDPSEMFVADDESDAPRREDSQRDQEARRALFGSDGQVARDVVDGADSADFVEPGAPADGGRRLLANWRENEEALRASLENFLPHVTPGNHTSVNASQADHASYIAGMHRTIHAEWGLGVLPRLAARHSNRHPLNDMDLQTVIEIVIDADSGEVVETGRAQPSGNEFFDAQALMIAQGLPDQPDPPESIISPDGQVYIHWTFWRDQRQCGTFGVRIFAVDDERSGRTVDDGARRR